MMGQFGFSYVGAFYLAMLIIPNLLWSKYQPVGYTAQNENKILVMFEHIGQVLVCATMLVFTDFNLHTFTPWVVWLILSFVLMLLYEGFWICYFRGGKTMKDFYGSYAGVPIAGATLPVCAFFLLGVYGKVIWLMIAAVIFGIGHIGIHYQHRSTR